MVFEEDNGGGGYSWWEREMGMSLSEEFTLGEKGVKNICVFLRAHSFATLSPCVVSDCADIPPGKWFVQGGQFLG